MEERFVECKDGTRWKVMVATRSSMHRLELVFEALGEEGQLLRGEAPAASLDELSDDELCFIGRELRASAP